jgi:hypothetical protein
MTPEAEEKDTVSLGDMTNVMRYLVQQVREDIPEEQGSRHLWDAVEDAEHLLETLA